MTDRPDAAPPSAGTVTVLGEWRRTGLPDGAAYVDSPTYLTVGRGGPVCDPSGCHPQEDA